MSTFQSGASNAAAVSVPQEEFIVRIPRDTRRKFTMMKFGTGAPVDFSKLGDQTVKIERENNLKEYKTANDLDMLPKFGAGSEYGRDLKEESRRKKYGIMLKKYNPEDQPWHLKIGSGKQAKRFKGVREGTIAENTSYYIFTKASDGAFEAYPVEEWYNFTPVVRYKYLNSEEAEEEYSRRDKTLNYFSIMVKKRLKKEDEILDDDEGETKGGKKKKKAKDLILTDKDEWDYMKMSDDDDDDSEADNNDDDDDGIKNKKKKPKGGAKKAVKNSKKNSDDEAVEESDEGDFDDKEVDYMSDSGSSSSLSDIGDEKDKKYDDKGVDQEAGLRNILDSDAEDEEEEGEKEEAEEEAEEKDEKKEEKKKDDDSSSSSSEDDSDIEKDAKLASAIFLQGGKKDKREKKDKSDASAPATESPQKTEQRTPTPDKLKDKASKRKADSPEGKLPSMKKHKAEECDGITEDAIRRYLMRKPMTTKDLLQKFKSKKLNMSNEKITHVIAQLLKKINPEKMTINKKLYLSLKKPE
ncbi:General transcription factor IIF subunit 1 [Bulinus truncatus]|nr:General transcription factor IIF subunit 1 [Bulinus truncatus]